MRTDKARPQARRPPPLNPLGDARRVVAGRDWLWRTPPVRLTSVFASIVFRGASLVGADDAAACVACARTPTCRRHFCSICLPFLRMRRCAPVRRWPGATANMGIIWWTRTLAEAVVAAGGRRDPHFPSSSAEAGACGVGSRSAPERGVGDGCLPRGRSAWPGLAVALALRPWSLPPYHRPACRCPVRCIAAGAGASGPWAGAAARRRGGVWHVSAVGIDATLSQCGSSSTPAGRSGTWIGDRDSRGRGTKLLCFRGSLLTSWRLERRLVVAWLYLQFRSHRGSWGIFLFLGRLSQSRARTIAEDSSRGRPLCPESFGHEYLYLQGGRALRGHFWPQAQSCCAPSPVAAAFACLASGKADSRQLKSVSSAFA